MNNLRGLLGNRRMERVPNVWIREFCRVTMWVDQRIDGVLRWFGHVDNLQNDRLAKRIYVGESAGSAEQMD